MKTVLLTLMTSILGLSAYSQGTPLGQKPTGVPLHHGSRVDMFVTTRAIDVSQFDGIAGSPFLTDTYQQAFVRTKSGEQFSNVWIRFNTLGNEIILENETQLVALTNVDSAAYTVNNPEKRNIIFKTGYPVIDDKNTNSIYQVLAYTDEAQFLKYYSTEIETIKKMGLPDQKTFVTKPVYYIYKLADKSITKVKLNKKSLQSALDNPGFEKKAAELSVNFKDEQDVIKLVSVL